jgi:hypothetical protein
VAFGHDEGVLDLTDYELVWPPELFATEVRRILARPAPDPEHLDLVMREAFRDNNVAEDLAAVRMGPAGSHNLGGSRLDSARDLADRAAEIRQYDAPRPYWPQRHGRDAGGPVLDRSTVRRGFDDLIAELERDGYLAQVFPRPCVDGDEPQPDISLELERRLGIAGLWPLRPESWDDDVFYGVIEVYHDLVSRPRARWYRDYGGCGWHYRDFATITGREVYRWRVNRLLASVGINYQLADRGKDRSRLVAMFDDARTELIADSMSHSQSDVAARVQHAIALFRKRATVEDKRSALVTLAGVLEERRQLIKDEMTSADEGTLFQIANKFAIRHRNAHQQADYDAVFLDWIFWWYLATIELTNRIVHRKTTAHLA